MDFMFLNTEDVNALNFDVRNEHIAEDCFLERAKKYICTNEETILYRQELFKDALKIEALSTFLSEFSQKLTECKTLIDSSFKSSNKEQQIHKLLFPEFYINLVEFVYASLTPIVSSTTSRSIKYLYELSKSDIESKEYQRIKMYYGKNSKKLNSIKSITIGVNLNATYAPKEAGILAVNDREFKSGDLLDRILRLDFVRDGFHCIAPLTTINKALTFQENQQLNDAILEALESVLDKGIKHCSNRMQRFVQEKILSYIKLHPSLVFVVSAINRLKVFQEKEIPLSFPKIRTDRTFDFISLYDDALCRKKEKKEIIPNSVCFSNDICSYIVMGTNGSGKTVFLNSIRFAQYYFQLGMPIPAVSASLPVCDSIYYLSPDDQLGNKMVGRFEKECIALSAILKKATSDSLILIDEVPTSISTSAAVQMAGSIISELCKIGSKCIFVTNHNNLWETKPKISECGKQVGYLHINGNNESCAHIVQKGKLKTSVSNLDIAKKYGIL